MAAVGKFVFVNYTGEPDVEAKQSLPTVRQHVMHDFFRRQREAENGDSTEGATSAVDVSAARTVKESRRRNTNTRQAASQPRPKRSGRKGPRALNNNNNQQSRQPSSSSNELVFFHEFADASSTSSGRTPSLDDIDSSPPGFTDSSSPHFSVAQSDLSPEVFDHSSPQSTALVQTNTHSPPAYFQSNQSATLQQPNPFLRSPAVHRWDPFNSMPLNGLAVDQLAGWHFHRPINRNNIWESKVLWLDKVDSHFRRGLWSIALTSTPLFHILLCIAEMKRGVLTGDRNQVAYFEHKIEAMRAISQGVSRLSSLPQFSSMALPCKCPFQTDEQNTY